MTERQTAIVNELQIGPIFADTLGVIVRAPTSSVRRNVQSLRRQGYNIVVDATGRYELKA